MYAAVVIQWFRVRECVLQREIADGCVITECVCVCVCVCVLMPAALTVQDDTANRLTTCLFVLLDSLVIHSIQL